MSVPCLSETLREQVQRIADRNLSDVKNFVDMPDELKQYATQVTRIGFVDHGQGLFGLRSEMTGRLTKPQFFKLVKELKKARW